MATPSQPPSAAHRLWWSSRLSRHRAASSIRVATDRGRPATHTRPTMPVGVAGVAQLTDASCRGDPPASRASTFTAPGGVCALAPQSGAAVTATSTPTAASTGASTKRTQSTGGDGAAPGLPRSASRIGAAATADGSCNSRISLVRATPAASSNTGAEGGGRVLDTTPGGALPVGGDPPTPPSPSPPPLLSQPVGDVATSSGGRSIRSSPVVLSPSVPPADAFERGPPATHTQSRCADAAATGRYGTFMPAVGARGRSCTVGAHSCPTRPPDAARG